MTILLEPSKRIAEQLRQSAESQLENKAGPEELVTSISSAEKMLHELQVHQIELQMQNSELRQTRITEQLHYRHTELFKFAPIAYFCFDENSTVNQVNLRGLSLLGIESDNLLGEQFSHYVTTQHRDTFNHCIEKVFARDGVQSCEIEVQIGQRNLWIGVEANLGITGTDCLTAMIDISDRKQTETKLSRAGVLQNAIFNSAYFSSIATDVNGVIQIFNVGAERMLGYTAAEVMNKITPAEISDPQEIIARADALSIELNTPIAPGFEALVYKARRGIEDIYELTYIRKDGSRFPALVSVTALRDPQNAIIGYLLIGTDNTARKEAQTRLQLSASVFRNAREGILITDAFGTIIEINDTFTIISGYSREEVLDENSRMFQSGRQSSEFYDEMWKSLQEKNHWYGEVWNRHKSGELYAVILTISAVEDTAGQIQNYVALYNDITLLKKHQDQLEHITHYDVLTHLPNRILLADRLRQAMVQCQRHHQLLAVAFLDIDNFKAVNDTHGHNVGDELLITLSQRMKEALRDGDTLSRIGGDEFIAVLTGLANLKDCQPILEALLLAASKPIAVGDVIFHVSASIGVTFYPQDSVNADQLIRHANQAMYVAKDSGKNRYHFFDIAQDDAIKLQRESLTDIRSALDNQQFVLHYQPKVNMRTGIVIGVEALIRWQHPERGLLNPIDFLPAIEHSPMMIELGEWVIDTALTQICQWQEMQLNLPLSISVNIAAVQIQQTNFTERLNALLVAHPDVNPRHLELEMLETSALNDVQHVSTTMNACMALGVSFALDDFGTGYSSLTYLRRLPANLIKIDQSFVREMLSNADDLAIVESIIGLAKSFKRDVIAEGAETIEHCTMLMELGCELAQGYGIARPMPASDFPAWAAHWEPDASWQA